jgi:hypothetical protein
VIEQVSIDDLRKNQVGFRIAVVVQDEDAEACLGKEAKQQERKCLHLAPA